MCYNMGNANTQLTEYRFKTENTLRYVGKGFLCCHDLVTESEKIPES